MTTDGGQNGPDGGAPQGGDGGDQGNGFKAPASQAELDRIIGDRVARERAKFADYDALKAKAQQFDSAKAASQTEAEKTAEQIAELQKKLADTQTTALRARVQAKHGISDEDAALFLTANDEATLNKQAERLSERTADRRKNGNRDPFAGRTPSKSGEDPMRAGVRQLLGRDD